MNNYYFTFGSSESFPFQRGYLIVRAASLNEAIEKFRNKYPDRHEGVVNCSSWYTEEQWNQNTYKEDKCFGVI